METLSITFERTLYQAVIRFKRENHGVLEAQTKQRTEGRGKTDNGTGGNN